MGVILDSNGHFIQNRIFLANPQKRYIGELSGVKEFSKSLNFNNMHEANFKIYEYENGERNEYYDDIIAKKLVEIQYVGWFEVTNVNATQDENSPYEYKQISCLSLENKLVDKNIDDINGVFALYDMSDTEHSLLHIISKLTNWKIGHVDNVLLGKKRTFAIDNAQIYNFLTTDVSKSFECIFVFNTYDKTINAYTLSNYGNLTDIVIHGRNILKGYETVSKGEDIVTKIKVVGGDGLDIRDVNPTATNYLINLDYFLVPISEGGWMTDGTINAYKAYQTAYDNFYTTYTSNRALLKSKLAELTTLNTQLKDLEGLKKAQEEIQGSYIQLYNGTPPIGTAEYTSYLNATNAISSYVTQIAAKKVDIKNKESEISNVRITLDNIGVDLNMSKYFTSAQLDELSDFLTEGDVYEDSTFIVTDTMTEDEKIDMKIELMQNGANELARASQPQFTTTISASNLFSMRDEPDSPISYSTWISQFEVGNLITIKFRDDYYVTARLIKIEIDFDNPSDIQLTFSNKNRLDNSLIQLGEITALAGRTASALSLAKFGYDQASKQVNEVREFINGTLDATLNAVQNNGNQELYIDEFGLHGRKWLPDQNKYGNYQMWLNTNNLLFSSDGFKTTQTAIGLLTAPDGDQFYGVATDVLIGNLILGSKLKIANSSGTYSIDNNGFSAINGIYSVGINPNTPSEIINIKVNGTKKLYIDVATNELMFNGKLTANAINADMINALNIVATSVKSSWVYTGSLNASQITAGSISGDRISGGTITGAMFKTTGGSYTTTLSDGYIDTSYMNFSLIEGGTVNCNTIGTYGSSSYVFINGELYAPRISTSYINGGSPVTFPLWTNEIEPSMTPVNIGFKGKNAATVTWCNDTFQPKASSDHRLKYEILSLDERFDNFFYNLKQKRYKFKPINDGSQDSPIDSDKIRIGLIAQQVKNNLINSGIEDDLAIIDTRQVRTYTNEGLYVNDDIMAIEYDELIALTIYEVQKLNNEICELKNKLRLYE